MPTAAQSLVYSTAEYCAPVWCHSAYTRLIDSVLNDALRIVTRCLHPTPTDHLPILLGIQPSELCRLGATLSLSKRGTLDLDHISHGQPAGLPDMLQKRLKSRHPFVPAARKLLNDLSTLGIRTARWMNYRWSAGYSKRTSVLYVFISRTSSRLLAMGLPRTFSVQLNRLRTGAGCFHSSMYKWDLALSPNCERGATNQTADLVISTCLTH